MGKINLVRTKEYNNRFRNFAVYVDDFKVGDIAHGEAKTFDVPDGQHTICCKIDWCGSPTIPFTIFTNETKRFSVGGYKFGSWLLPFFLTAICLLPVFGKSFAWSKYIYYLYLPFVAVLVYYLTIGRKKYLRLTELKDPSGDYNTKL